MVFCHNGTIQIQRYKTQLSCFVYLLRLDYKLEKWHVLNSLVNFADWLWRSNIFSEAVCIFRFSLLKKSTERQAHLKQSFQNQSVHHQESSHFPHLTAPIESVPGVQFFNEYIYMVLGDAKRTFWGSPRTLKSTGCIKVEYWHKSTANVIAQTNSQTTSELFDCIFFSLLF